MIEVTKELVIKTLGEIVADFGEDYVYPDWAANCVYADENDLPSCIVGHFLHRIGLNLDAVADNDSAQFLGTYYYNDAVFDSEALECLRTAQISQDSGGTWGEALRDAKAAVE